MWHGFFIEKKKNLVERVWSDEKKNVFDNQPAMVQNGQNGLAPGNTIPGAKKQRESTSKYWCFTFNNYCESDVVELVNVFKSFDLKYIFGEEVGKEGTPHLQGYIESKKPIRWSGLRLPNKIHWEKRRGTREQNLVYCTKENGPVHTNMKIPRPIEMPILTGWQTMLKETIFAHEPVKRKIYWIWSRSGERGKSSMVRYMAMNDALVCSGKAADMKYLIVKWKETHGDYPEHVVFDVPRSMENFLSYQGIEEIKNGVFASTKYECEMVVMNQPNVYIFANFPPDMNNEVMSQDRFVIWDVE